MNYAITVPMGIDSDLVSSNVVGTGLTVKDSSGNIFYLGWWIQGKEFPDSDNHINVNVDAQCKTLSTEKSTAIAGISEFSDFMLQWNLSRCNEDGSQIIGEVL